MPACEPRFEPVSDTHQECVCCGLRIFRDTTGPIRHPCSGSPPAPAPARGLGDVVARVATKLGFRKCGGCSKRQAKLNRWFPFERKG